jgi:hypothetical protein
MGRVYNLALLARITLAISGVRRNSEHFCRKFLNFQENDLTLWEEADAFRE